MKRHEITLQSDDYLEFETQDFCVEVRRIHGLYIFQVNWKEEEKWETYTLKSPFDLNSLKYEHHGKDDPTDEQLDIVCEIFPTLIEAAQKNNLASCGCHKKHEVVGSIYY